MRIINLAHGDLAVLGAFLGLRGARPLGTSRRSLALVPVAARDAAARLRLLQRTLLERSLRGGPLIAAADHVRPRRSSSRTCCCRSSRPTCARSAARARSTTGELADHRPSSRSPCLGALTFALAVARARRPAALPVAHRARAAQMRATAQDPDTAELVGVDARRGVRARHRDRGRDRRARRRVLRACARRSTRPAGPTQLIFAFEAVVIGGLGSLWGTLLGGIVLGVAQTIGAQIDPQYSILAGHLVFLAVLAVARGGLFADAGATRMTRRRCRSARGRAASTSSGGRRSSIAFDRGASAVARDRAVRCVPFVFSAERRRRSSPSLLILVILAAMWNALAGYGGLVSVGQQAFIGIGAYGTICPRRARRHALPRDGARRAVRRRWRRCPSRCVLRLRGGQFAVGIWVVAEVFALLVTLDQSLGGGTGMLADRAQRLRAGPARRHTPTGSTLGLTVAAARAAVRPAAQPARRGAAGDPRRRGRGRVARRARDAAPSASLFVLAGFGCGAAGALTLVNTLFIQPQSIFGVQWTAYMIFMVLVGGLGTFEGPILGALVLFVIQHGFGDSGVWYLVGLGAAAIVFALLTPAGRVGDAPGAIRAQADARRVQAARCRVGLGARGIDRLRSPACGESSFSEQASAASSSRRRCRNRLPERWT